MKAQSAAPNREEVIKLRSTDLPLLLFNIRKNIKSKLFGFTTNQDVSEQEQTLVDVTLIDIGIIIGEKYYGKVPWITFPFFSASY